MSNIELTALGIILPVTETDTETAGATTDETASATNIDNATMSATAATQVNPYHDVADLSSPEVKKLYQKSTEGLPIDQKYDSDDQDIIKFVECIESKGEYLG